MKELVQIFEKPKGEFDAGGKAPSDAARIAEHAGFRIIEMLAVSHQTGIRRYVSIAKRILVSLSLLLKIKRSSILFLQYPSSMFGGKPEFLILRFLLKHKAVKLVTLVHDLDGLRSLRPNAAYDPNNCIRRVMKFSHRVIVHNTSMIDWCVRVYGCPKVKLINLEIFDYLTDVVPLENPDENFNSVTIAGNLQPGKSAYLTQLKEVDKVNWSLFGPCYDEKTIGAANVTYNGCVASAKLPEKLTAGFGLVWDGNSVDTCEGVCGKYLLYNNPHKLSLYLVSGLPVIIWDEAAEAGFVKENGVGLTVSSLRKLNEELANMTIEKYKTMRNSVLQISIRLRGGYYLAKALECATNESREI